MRAWLLACAALLLGTAPAAAAAPSYSDGFGVRPVKRHGEELAASYFQITAQPGQRQRQAVVAWNSSKRPIKLLVDGVDGVTGTTSGAVYANAEDGHLETSRWIRPAARHVTIAPGQQRVLRFVVRIPDDARPGEHLGGLAFQNAETPQSGSRFSVRQVLRIVLGVQVTIPGGRPAQAALGAVQLTALPGTQVPAAVLELGNEGQLGCKPNVRVAIRGQGQRRAVSQKLDTILPGDQIAFPLALRGRLPAGRYLTTTTVEGCGARHASEAQLVLATSLSGTTPQPTPTHNRAAVAGPTPTPMWLVALALIVGVGGGLAVATWWQRRRGSNPAAADVLR